MIQRYIGCLCAVFQGSAPLETWNGNNVVALRQQPGKGDLRVGCGMFQCNLADDIDKFQIGGEILALIARVLPPPVIIGQVVKAADRPG